MPVVVALVLCALSAASASAESPDWIISGKPLSGSAALANTAEVTENGKLKFSSTTIECTGKNLEGVSPQIESNDKGSATSLTFTECSTIAGSTCTIVGQPISISTVPLAVLAETTGDLEVTATFKAKTKVTFATINFTGANCALAGVQPVTGSAKVTGPTGQMEQTLQEIVANTTLGELKVGSAEATLQGKALLRLVSGSRWSFDQFIEATGYALEKGAELVGTAKNPLDLAIIISSVVNTGGGPILGGTCKAGLLIASLAACTVKQDHPVGAYVTYLVE